MKGVLLVNKTKGKTSRDMVNELNHIFGMKKIGHTGTLDPIATGVLVVCLGKYTKLVDLLSAMKKEYIAEIKLGIKTDTLDITGQILETQEVPKLTEKAIEEVLNSFKGHQKQTVPLYSAKKINGKKLYEYAREHKSVALPENEIKIYDINLISFNDDIIRFKTTVSKGTYIRSLIESICRKLGTVGTMSSLVRTKQGRFTINDSYTITDIQNGNYQILSVKDLFDYPVYNLNDEEYNKVKNGNKISINSQSESVILTKDNQEIAIYVLDNDLYRPKIMLM